MKKKFHILLADDDIDDRFFFEMALKELLIPTQFNSVEDGEKLIHFLNRNNKALPDVIFLDLNMPRKKGYECLGEIKADEALRHIPVIIYSTSLHKEVADLFYQQGAHFYLKKCEFRDLPIILNKIIPALQKNPEKPSKDKFIINSYEYNF